MEKLLNEKVMSDINEEALRAKTILDEIASKRRIEEEKRLREKKLEEEEEIRRRREKLNSISLQEIANDSYLLSFKTLLERIQENDELDCSEESLKIKLDLVEQLNNMKIKHSLDTICHIESDKIQNSTRFRYWVMKSIFKRKKYRIVFHSKKIKIEDIYFEERINYGSMTIFAIFVVYLVQFVCFLPLYKSGTDFLISLFIFLVICIFNIFFVF